MRKKHRRRPIVGPSGVVGWAEAKSIGESPFLPSATAATAYIAKSSVDKGTQIDAVENQGI